MVDELKEFLEGLRSLRSAIRKEKTERINKQNLRSRAEQLAREWFGMFRTRIEGNKQISTDTLSSYHDRFTRLLKLSSPSNRKASYMDVLNEVIKNFNDEIVLPVATSSVSASKLPFSELMGQYDDLPEFDYLSEAIHCADSHYFRAAAVLGWSAAVYRIHKRIEQIGFDEFNNTSDQMSSLSKGRFKRYNKKYYVASLNELNEVFDTDLLWLIEGMGLIDLNEHTRLRSCFDLRCQCAHPGNAPVTEYNLMSFFSDIKEIVFKNPKFSIT